MRMTVLAGATPAGREREPSNPIGIHIWISERRQPVLLTQRRNVTNSMGGVSWAETEERIERDDGDPDDVVYVLTSGKRRSAYHDDDTCSGVSREGQEIAELSRSEAQRRLCFPCKTCTLGERENNGGTSHPETIFSDLIAADRRRRAAEGVSGRTQD
jgi:hypothetical protein